jgi:hypothetical protein
VYPAWRPLGTGGPSWIRQFLSCKWRTSLLSIRLVVLIGCSEPRSDLLVGTWLASISESDPGYQRLEWNSRVPAYFVPSFGCMGSTRARPATTCPPSPGAREPFPGDLPPRCRSAPLLPRMSGPSRLTPQRSGRLARLLRGAGGPRVDKRTPFTVSLELGLSTCAARLTGPGFLR